MWPRSLSSQVQLLIVLCIAFCSISINSWKLFKPSYFTHPSETYSRISFQLFYREKKASQEQTAAASNKKKAYSAMQRRKNDYISAAYIPQSNNWQQSQSGLFVESLEKLFRSPDRDQVAAAKERVYAIEAGSLHSLLTTHLPQMSASMTSATLYYLAMLSQRQLIASIAESDRELLLKHLYERLQEMNAYDISISLVGLARLSVSCRTALAVPSFSFSLIRALSKMNAKQISDSLWSLASMDCQWEYLSPIMKRAILENIERIGAAGYDSFALPSIVWAVAKIGIKWHEVSATMREDTIAQLMKYSQELSPQQSSKILWSLGTLGCSSINEFPTGLIEALIDNINMIKRSQVGHAVTAGQALTGLAKLGVSWSSLSKNVKAGLWEQLMRVSESPNDKALSNAIWALGSMGAPIATMPVTAQEKMMTSINRIVNECSSWTLCNIIWGFARMDLHWNQFDDKLQESIIMNIARLAPSMNDIDVAVLIWSLGELDAPMDRFPEYVLEEIFESILKNIMTIKPQELSQILWGLSGSGIAWDRLPQTLRWALLLCLRRVADDMNPQHLANTAYAFAILSYDSENTYDSTFRGAHESLLATIQRHVHNLVPPDSSTRGQSQAKQFEQLRIFANYLVALHRIADISRIPSILVDQNRSAHMHETVTSNLQDTVIQSLVASLNSSEILNKNEYRIVMEYSGFEGVFPVDAAVLRQDTLVALIEVDGPTHYRYDGSLRRKDHLKELMYRNMNPDVMFRRVRWDETKALGTQTITDEIASSIVLHAKKIKPWTGTLRNFERYCSAFFSWSLRSDKNF
jgi:hypothetical protein